MSRSHYPRSFGEISERRYGLSPVIPKTSGSERAAETMRNMCRDVRHAIIMVTYCQLILYWNSIWIDVLEAKCTDRPKYGISCILGRLKPGRGTQRLKY